MAGLFSAWSIFAADFSALLTTSFETRWHLPEFFFFRCNRSDLNLDRHPKKFFNLTQNPKFLKKLFLVWWQSETVEGPSVPFLLFSLRLPRLRLLLLLLSLKLFERSHLKAWVTAKLLCPAATNVSALLQDCNNGIRVLQI